MIFFKKELIASDIFMMSEDENEVVEKIKREGKWINPPVPATYTDKIAVYSYQYAYEQGLCGQDVTSFVSTLTSLISGLGASFGLNTEKEIEIEYKAIDLLNSLNVADPEMDELKKAKALVHFVLTLYKQSIKEESVKKSVLLPVSYVNKINDEIKGDNFTDKLRNLIFDYFEK
jgi:hypothetical protein